jgi:hypothetical protein
MGDHQKSLRHKSTVQRAERAPQALISATASAGNVRLYPMVNRRECCSASYTTCRLHPPRSRLIHLRYSQSLPHTIQMIAAPQTKNIAVTKVPGQITLTLDRMMIKTGRFATRIAGGADIVQIVWTTNSSRSSA